MHINVKVWCKSIFIGLTAKHIDRVWYREEEEDPRNSSNPGDPDPQNLSDPHDPENNNDPADPGNNNDRGDPDETGEINNNTDSDETDM